MLTQNRRDIVPTIEEIVNGDGDDENVEISGIGGYQSRANQFEGP